MANGVQAKRSTNQTLTTATQAAVIFDGVNFDTQAYWAAINPTRLTIPSAFSGQYAVVGSVSFVASAVGVRQMLLRKNGSIVLMELLVPPATGFASEYQISAIVNLVASDYLELLLLQTSGANLDAQVSSIWSPALAISFLGT